MTIFHTAAGFRTIEELERLAYCAGMALTADLCSLPPLLEQEYKVLDKQNEVRDEQSEFRRQLLEDILNKCQGPEGQGGARKLARAILAMIENSYVEL